LTSLARISFFLSFSHPRLFLHLSFSENALFRHLSFRGDNRPWTHQKKPVKWNKVMFITAIRKPGARRELQASRSSRKRIAFSTNGYWVTLAWFVTLSAPSKAMNESEEFDGADGKPQPERGLSTPY